MYSYDESKAALQLFVHFTKQKWMIQLSYILKAYTVKKVLHLSSSIFQFNQRLINKNMYRI